MSFSLSFAQVTRAAPWPARYGHACVAWQGRLWLLGGTETCDEGRQLRDVWSSSDGLHWECMTEHASWPPRWAHAVFACGDRLVLIGGLDSVNPIHNLADIWTTCDGANWTQASAPAPWLPRHVWATAVAPEALWIIGGATSGQLYHNDVWRSDDGCAWRETDVVGPRFSPRKNHAAAVLGDGVYVLGGSVLDASAPHGARYVNDVWRSADGAAWDLVCERAPWRPRCFHHLLSWSDSLWLSGGNFGGADYSDAIWRSPDGANWDLISHFPWPRRHAETMTLWRGRVWVMGGTSTSHGTTAHNDI